MDPFGALTGPPPTGGGQEILAWLKALAGAAVPTTQSMTAPMPNLSTVGNIMNSLFPPNPPGQSLLATRPDSPLGKLFGNVTPPAPVAPIAPAPTGGIGSPGFAIPAVPTRATSGGGPQNFSIPAGPELPAPPILPPPPQMPIPGGANYGPTRRMADASKPGPVDMENLNKAHVSAVLGGLAGGAGSVDATDAGSFAKALAMAGAGGSKGATESNLRSDVAKTRNKERTEDWQWKRAGLEKDISTAQANQALQRSEIAFRNAKLTYDNQIANQAAQYEFNVKKLGLEAPLIKHDANGITISQLDPATRQRNIQYIPTKPVFEQLEKMEGTFKALGMDTPMAKAANIEMLTKTFASNPIAGREAFKQATVRDIIKSGAGASVFGTLYAQAAKEAETDLKATGGPALLAKPELYLGELQSRIAARLLANPAVANQGDWIVRAMPHSPYAAVLGGPAVPQRNNPNAAPVPEIAD